MSKRGVVFAKGQARRIRLNFVSGVAIASWFAISLFMDRTGLEDRLVAATEPFHDSLSGSILFLLLLPVFIATLAFATSDFEAPSPVPRALRLSLVSLQVVWRGMALAAGMQLMFLSARLLQEEAVGGMVGVGVVAVVVTFWLRRSKGEAARKTLERLYEAVRDGDSAIRDDLCEQEASRGLEALEAGYGKLSWYRVREMAIEEHEIAFFLETVRDRMPKFEEVILSPDGRRVVDVAAEGI